jgi:ATP-dependent DNA helicase RecG
MFDLKSPIEKLYLVGPARAKLLKHLGIETLEDLLFYLPRAHHDLSHFIPIAEAKANEFANIKAKILSVKSFRTRVRRFTLTTAVVEDDSGTISCVWFNQPYLQKTLKVGEQFMISGKAVVSKGKLQLQNPVYESAEKQEQVHTARLVPVYPLTAHITQKILRNIIKTYLDQVPVPEFLPAEILREEKFLDETKALRQFHFPNDWGQLKAAQKRLAFDEIFITQLRVLRYKMQRQHRKSFPIKDKENLLEGKIAGLPFELTSSQEKALKEILGDMAKPYPGNRLLEGDVGSGKTIIAALTMWLAAQNGLQAVLLAPTEVLAQQHYVSLLKLFLNDGLDLGLMTSASTRLNGNPVSKETILAHIKNGRTKLVIGTHALLEKTVKFEKLALIVIDEQHRFGVQQRAALKEHNNAHLLTMSATPIPRTLALTLYGDLDLSILSELPKGRTPIVTELVAEDKRNQTYQFINEQIAAGRQAFVVCPLIEESDKLGVKSAQAEFKKLSEEVFPHLKIGLMHGKLKPADKEKVMAQFKDNEIQVLVSTSVVEVGVDVPNATVMMIEGSERFGLAQLHQFRGRVGRSTHQSYCFMFSDDPQASNNPRLLAMVQSSNGFELAQKDLQIRGSGDLYGTAQSGYGFKVATLSNLEIVERSRQYAEKILEKDPEIDNIPLLKQKVAAKPEIHLE